MIQDPFALVVVLFGVIFVSAKLVDRFGWARKVSAVVLILFLTAVASNLGFIPTEAAIYSQLIDFSVPFAVCLVLFTVNLGDLRRAGKTMIVAFGVASVATIVGVLVASLALEPFLQRILGAGSWRLAGPYTGTYIGGSLNFFALWDGLEIGRPDLFAAANAVDNLTVIPLMAIWILVPSWIGHRFPVAERWGPSEGLPAAGQDEVPKPRFLPVHVATLVFAALLVIAVSEWVTSNLLAPILPQVPTILVITTFSLLLGQLRYVRRLEGGWELGQLSFYLFFAGVGAMINLYNAVVLSPILFAYVLIIMAVHMSLVYGIGRALRIDIGVLTIASCAAKAGPALVAPLTELKGWKSLTLPGIIMGLAGYAVGNYVGFAVAYLVRALLGG